MDADVHVGHDRTAQGHPAHALHPGDVRDDVGQCLAPGTGVGGAAFGRHRVQWCDDDDSAGIHAGLDTCPASRVRCRGLHSDRRARTRHAYDARSFADHRRPQCEGLRPFAAHVARDDALARRSVAPGVQGPAELAAATPVLRTLRFDRGFHHDPRPRRRAAQVRQRRGAAAVLRDANRRRRRARPPAARDRRNRRSRADHDARLLQPARADGGSAARRLAFHRRPGLRRRRRLSVHRRSQEGHDRQRRRQGLSEGRRGNRRAPSGDTRGDRFRHPARKVGRDARRGGRAARQGQRRRRGAARLDQCSRRCEVPARRPRAGARWVPAQCRWQDTEARAARAVLGRASGARSRRESPVASAGCARIRPSGARLRAGKGEGRTCNA